MEDASTERTCTAFAGVRRVARGSVKEVALAAKGYLEEHGEQNLLIFDDETAQPVELDLRGTTAEILARLSPGPEPTSEKKPGPGRPKLGVVCQEVCLLPRHWEWLSTQSGGASASLRRLVEDARKANQGKDRARRSQEAAHRFMWAMAGNFEGFEEAGRAFFARDYEKMRLLIQQWPCDVRDTLWKMVERVAEDEKSL